ncbi:hypothetical protein PV11_01770 [Exophiala sideris]|uniref:C2H2-type domain-containing protein n=1 Tax=Exophiala sideris TaxID=1016849 RepID=A0A0D1XDU1_9EURO|nr:hypothetical protein PV11_01770 [Exophiala sideris]
MANKRKHDGDDSERPRPAPGIEINFGHVFVSAQDHTNALAALAGPNGLAIRIRHGNVFTTSQQRIDALAEAGAMQAANIVTVGNASGVAIESNGNERNAAGDEEMDGVKDEDGLALQHNLLPDPTLPDNVLAETALPNNALPMITDLPNTALPGAAHSDNALSDNALSDSVLPGNALHDNPLPNDLIGDDPFSSVGYNGDGIVTPPLNPELNVLTTIAPKQADANDDLVITSERPAKRNDVINNQANAVWSNRLRAASKPPSATHSVANNVLNDAMIANKILNARMPANSIAVEEADEEEEAVENNEPVEKTEQQAKGPLPGLGRNRLENGYKGTFHGAYNLPADNMENVESIGEDVVAKIDVGSFFGKGGTERLDKSGFTGSLTFNSTGLVVLCLHCGGMFSSLSGMSKHRKLEHKGCNGRILKQCYSKRVAFQLPKSYVEKDKKFRWDESECLRRYIAELKGVENTK